MFATQPQPQTRVTYPHAWYWFTNQLWQNNCCWSGNTVA